ncbi:MAG: thioredoxin family protein [Microscillaceae bacterium]|nr:thioredoxin family protein [Microscillaceae bacterium]
MRKFVLIFSLLIGITVLMNAEFKTNGYKVGDKIADFSLKNTVDDKMVSLAGYKKAKGFIVVFTCNHCPFAQMWESRIMQLDKDFAAKGYPVIAISSNDPTDHPDDAPGKMTKRAQEKGYTFPYLYDETQTVAKAFGATKTPHVYVISKKGTDMIVEFIGAVDDNARDEKSVSKTYTADAVNALLSGKEIKVKEVPAVGCSIKFKAS